MPLTTTFAGASIRGLGMFAPSATGGVFDLITPTSTDVAGSGSSATIGSNGSVSFSACTSLSLNGVFSAAYDNYHIVLKVQYSNFNESDFSAKLRVAGTDASGGDDYNTNHLYGSGTSLVVSEERASGRLYIGKVGNTTRNGISMQVFSPFKTVPTAMSSQTSIGNDIAIGASWASHELSVSYDGITFAPSGGVVAGSVAVYGLGI